VELRHIVGVGIGVVVGMLLAYFGAGSAGVGNLAVGAVIGALVGLYFVSAAAMQAGATSGEHSGMG
jgi:hypothetical protein